MVEANLFVCSVVLNGNWLQDAIFHDIQRTDDQRHFVLTKSKGNRSPKIVTMRSWLTLRLVDAC